MTLFFFDQGGRKKSCNGNDEAKVIKIRLGTMNLVYNVRTCKYVCMYWK